MKNKIFRSIAPSGWTRETLRSNYRDKYFNLFLNKYKLEGVTREEREFILRQFWAQGAVAAFRINDEIMGFAPFVPQNFNMYNYPTEVTLVNLRGVRYIPTKPLKTGGMRLNKARMVEEPEVVLIYAQHSRQPLQNIVFDYIDRIVEVEMTIRTNLFAQKLPVLFKTTPENREQISAIWRAVVNDELGIEIGVDDVNNIDSFNPSIPYLIAQLYEYKQQLESELQTFLGFDNLAAPKKERLAVDEANANNEVINDYEDAVLDNLEEGFDLVNEAFGTAYRPYVKEPISASFHDEEDTEEREEETENE